jgi:hypothetical protein
MLNRIGDDEFNQYGMGDVRLLPVTPSLADPTASGILFEIVFRSAALRSIQIRLVALLDENLIVSSRFQL